MSGGGELIVQGAVDPALGPPAGEVRPSTGQGRRRSLWSASFARLIRIPAAAIPCRRASSGSSASAASSAG